VLATIKPDRECWCKSGKNIHYATEVQKWLTGLDSLLCWLLQRIARAPPAAWIALQKAMLHQECNIACGGIL